MVGARQLLGIVIALSLAACGARRNQLGIKADSQQQQQQDSDGHLYTPLNTQNDTEASTTSSTTQATSSSSGSNVSSSGTTTSINPAAVRVNISVLIGKWHGHCDLAPAETVLGVELQRTSASAIFDKSVPGFTDGHDYFHIANRPNCTSTTSAPSYCQVNASMRHFAGVTALTMMQVHRNGMLLIKAGAATGQNWFYLGDQFGLMVPVSQVISNENLVHDLGNGYAVEIRRTESNRPHVICGS